MLKSIQWTNLKGSSAIQKLTGKDIFIGLNGAGKSTRLEAACIALLGYIPTMGKKMEETMKQASNDQMSASAETDDFYFSRTFNRIYKDEKDGTRGVKISQKISVAPSLGEKKDEEKKARIIAEVGNFPVMIDFDEFLKMTDTARRDFFYELSGNTEVWTRATIIEHLDKILATKELAENNEDHFNIMVGILNDCVKQYPERFDVQQGLQSMLDWATEKLSYWKSEKDKSEGASKKIAELKNELTDTDRNIGEHKKQLEDLQQELIKLEKQISADIVKKKAIDDRLNRIKVLHDEIQQQKDMKPDGDINELTKQLEEAQKSLYTLKDLAEILEGYDVSIHDIKVKAEAKQQERDELFQQGIAAKTARETYEATINTIEVHAGVCVIDKLIDCNKDFTRYLKFARNKAAENKAIQEDAHDKIVALDAEIKSAKDEIAAEEKKKQTEIDEHNRQVRENNATQAYINTLQNNINNINNFESFREQKIKERQDEILNLQSEDAGTIGDITIMEKQAEALRSNIKDLKSKIEEQEKAKTTLSNLKATMIDSKEASYRVECFKQLTEALGTKGIKGEIVKEMLGPIRGEIHENLRLMGIDDEFYFQTESDTGREIFQFGWINKKGHKVNFDTLNNAHRSFLLVAILTAIIEHAAPKLKVLMMDDIEHIIEDDLRNFIAGLNAIAHKWDNILLAMAIKELDVEGFKVWNLSGGDTI
ncbi:MAG TPA: AAA family ATPase [Clostridia bacterium]|nr:AAA family ATPase [Clostridia bacterium]